MRRKVVVLVLMLMIASSISAAGINIRQNKLQTSNSNPQTMLNDLSTWDGVYFFWNDTNEVRGEWQIVNNVLARQLHNCDPCMLLHPLTAPVWNLGCKFRVNSNVDNDYIGFVFGYVNKSQFYILDWKQSLTKEQEGFTVRKIQASSPDFLWRNEFKADTDTSYMEILDTEWEQGLGWVNYQWYEFRLEFDRGDFSLRIWNGSNVLYDKTITDGTFQKGRVGFYTCSQEMTEFTDSWVEYSTCSNNINSHSSILSIFKNSKIFNQLSSQPIFNKILHGLLTL
jgi:hypothetical protein